MNPLNDDIVIQLGIPDPLRRRAATIYYDAFEKKLRPILGTREQTLAILEESLRSDYAFVALADGDLVGIAGFHEPNGQMVDIHFDPLRRHLGWIKALWAAVAGSLLTRNLKPHQLLMDGISVEARMRGKGVGTCLLDAVTDYAREHGFHTVALDVINTNPDARRLYERKGFQALTTQQYGWLTSWLGFTSSTSMVKSVTPLE